MNLKSVRGFSTRGACRFFYICLSGVAFSGISLAQVGPDASSRFSLPPFEDPFQSQESVACEDVAEREREKIDCRSDGATQSAPLYNAPSTSGGSSELWSTALPDYSDPFSPSALPPACDDLEAPEREKFGYSEECLAATEPSGGDSDDLVDDDTGLTAGVRPLFRDDIPDLYRRVLSLPGAALAESAGSQSTNNVLPTFTIYHVYEEVTVADEVWLRVGKDAFGGLEGWLPAKSTEDWRTMLVMEFAPKGSRGRVLFFKREDDLIDFATDRYAAAEVQSAYDEIDEGVYDADYFIAIEPTLGVSDGNTYLMPILDHRPEFTASGERIHLLQVAGLNVDTQATLQTDVRDIQDRGLPRRAGALRRAKIGLVFLIDTTRSMGSYIDFTRSIVRSTVESLQASDAPDMLSYGLIGFRDNLSADDRIEYVTKIFQPLDPNAEPIDTLRNFELMEAADVATSGFSEDAFAGLDSALNDLDWEPFAGKMIFLITDAAPRKESDPLVAEPGYGPINIIEDANRHGVGIVVIHLQTPAAIKSGNFMEARPVYRTLTRTGDIGFEKYLTVDTSSPEGFADEIRQIQSDLNTSIVEFWGRGRPVKKPGSQQPGFADNAGQALVNELFRGQLEYLGEDRNQSAPRFYRAWAVDKDLRDLTVDMMEVKAFLTRNQLAALSKGVQNILDAYLRKKTGGGDFFDSLQIIAAETSVEGGRRGNIERAGQLLPSFLEALPYTSDFLNLSRDFWRSMRGAEQREQIDLLKSKLIAYQDLASDRQGWIDLGAGDKGLETYPVSLTLLP